MINKALLEMESFDSAKETDNKLRWDKSIGDIKFSLYIPKWRVPQPWPSRIYVDIIPLRSDSEDLPNLSPELIRDDPSLVLEPIVVTAVQCSEHTKTIQYQPVGDKKNWEIGEPYVPKELIDKSFPRIRIIVLWDITSRGTFQAPNITLISD